MIQAGPSLVARLDDAFNNIPDQRQYPVKSAGAVIGDENQTALTQVLQHLSVITGAVVDRSQPPQTL